MRVEVISNHHNRAAFDCGIEQLNNFLRHFSLKHTTNNTSKTYVLSEEQEPEIIKGYYTVSAGSVAFEHIPKNLPKHPIPVFHIGRLAVDTKYQGQKYGKFLLMDALQRARMVATQMGIYAIDVIAKDEAAKGFYKKYGFSELLDDTMHLYLPIKVVMALR